MAVSTRQQLKEYCLRNLGAPVLEINAEDDQLEDRIDEALEYWRLYHSEGVEKVYLKHRINASTLTLQQPVAEIFPLTGWVVGRTSSARAKVVIQSNKESQGTELIIRYVDGDFQAGEIIEAESDSSINAQLSSAPGFYTPGETELKYLQLSDWVYGVVRLIPFAGTQTSKSMFDIQYQLRLNDLYDLASTSIIYYKMVMGHLALLDLELNGKPQMNFNRMQGRVYPIIDWEGDIQPGDFVVIECYRALNPVEFSKVWNESWLKHYTTALFKRMWATNLKKFSGVQLPGGVTIDGQSMYQEAMAEIKELEDSLMGKSAPLDFYMG